MSHNKSWFLLCLLGSLLALCLLPGCDCGDDDDNDDNQPADDDDASPADDDNDDASPDDDDDDDDDDDNDDNDDDVVCDYASYDPLIDEGNQLLSAGDNEAAYGAYHEALDLCPDEPDAKMGLLISDTQWYLQFIYRLIDYIINFPVTADKTDPKSIASIFQELIREQMLPVTDEMIALADDLRANHPKARFFIDPLPMLLVDGHAVLEMAGEWDLADFDNVKAFAQILEGLWYFLITYDLRFDLTIIFNAEPPASPTTEELIHFYAGLLLEVLADPNYPDFLTFLDDGEANLETSALQAGRGLIGVVTAFYSMREETDPQEDDIAGYVDENGNGQWDEGEPFKVPYFGDLWPEGNVFFEDLFYLMNDLGEAFLDTGPEDVHPAKPDWFMLSDVNFILEFFDVFVPGIALPDLSVPIGRFFYSPPDDGLRGVVQTVAQLLYDLTAPDETEVLP